MILGFTGTRNGLTRAQIAAFLDVVSAFPTRALHGGAVGADAEFDAFIGSGLVCPVEVYPADAERHRFWSEKPEPRVIHPYLPPLARNGIIAERCDALLATPATPVEITRSGTWATVRYARAFGRPITLILPDGTVREEK